MDQRAGWTDFRSDIVFFLQVISVHGSRVEVKFTPA